MALATWGRIVNTTIVDNFAFRSAGGVLGASRLPGCRIIRNTSFDCEAGGVMILSDAVLSDCLFEDNDSSATDHAWWRSVCAERSSSRVRLRFHREHGLRRCVVEAAPEFHQPNRVPRVTLGEGRGRDHQEDPTMRRPLERSETRELEMTPMIDVTFLLLIFFMCTLKFKTLEGKLEAFLPKDVGVSPAAATELERVAIEVEVLEEGRRLDPVTGAPWDGQGRYRFDSSRRLSYRVGPFRTTRLSELLSRLKQLRASDPTLKATLDARPGVVYADVVKVLDLVLAAGFQELTFVGRRQ